MCMASESRVYVKQKRTDNDIALGNNWHCVGLCEIKTFPSGWGRNGSEKLHSAIAMTLNILQKLMKDKTLSHSSACSYCYQQHT